VPNRTTTVNGLRPCRSCNEMLPATDEYFMRTKKGSPHFRSHCRSCMNKKSAEWRANNPDKNKAARADWAARNRDYMKDRNAEWRANNPDKVQAQRQATRLRQHGLTQEQYDELFESQGGCCAICGTTDPGPNWAIDHDHSCCGDDVRYRCGECVRGILCPNCNTGIGMLQDDLARLEAAITYLRETRAVSTSDRLTA
jgi:hypothetical protein